MARHLASQSRTRQRWHEHIERYTPNGAFGRLLFAATTGPISGLSLLFSVLAITSASFPWVMFGFLFAGVGLAAGLLTIMMLWPIYLSLIGNIESTKAYPQANTMTSSKESPDDAITVVKQQYAAGNISESEFERRLDTLLHVDAESNARQRSHQDRSRDRLREMD